MVTETVITGNFIIHFSRFALIAGGSSTPTDKKHLLGTPHARGPRKSLDRALVLKGILS